MKRDGSPDESRPGLSTRAIHAGSPATEPGAPVVAPIYQAATFFTEFGDAAGEVRYTRYGTNPNHELAAARLADLEGAERALVLASGNAAMALSMLACVGGSGAHIVALDQLYGGTFRLLTRDLPRFGIDTTFVPIDGDWASAVRAETRAFVVEVMVNPTLRVPDLPAICALANERGIPVIVDATFATPVNCRPIEHGASLVVHSATKYLGGHSDLSAGVVAGSAVMVEKVRQLLMSFGPVLDPHATWLLERGIKTLPLRMKQHNENAATFARHFETHPDIRRVHYPGLASHEDHERAARLLDGMGGMVSLVIEGGDARALRVVQHLQLIAYAPSLGGVESLVSLPRFTSHASMTPEQRSAVGIEDGFLRISVGVENVADLIADFERALAAEPA